jgi:hypothetical protein
MQKNLSLSFASSLVVLGAVACSTAPGNSSNDEPGGSGNGGSTSSAAGDNSGGTSSPIVDGGAAGAAGAGTEDPCTAENAELIPDLIDVDLNVGPGCLTMTRTRLADGATLTIAPGSTVLMQSNASLWTGNAAVDSGTAALVAVGSAEAPIVFTSAAAEPAPGDWQCLRLTRGSAASHLEHVTLEYGGLDCGTGDEALLVVNGSARVEHVTLAHSSAHPA